MTAHRRTGKQNLLFQVDMDLRDPLTIISFTIEDLKERTSDPELLEKIELIPPEIKRIRNMLDSAQESNQESS